MVISGMMFAPLLKTSGLTVDSDITIPTAYKLKTNHIAETTTSHGIVHDHATTLTGGVTGAMAATGAVSGTTITGTGAVSAPSVTTDHIAEKTATHGIVTDNRLHCAGGVSGPAEAVMRSVATISIANSNTETSVAAYTIPANFLTAGTYIRIKVAGTLTTKATCGYGRMFLRLGATAGAAPVIIQTADGYLSSSVTGGAFDAEALLEVRTTGATGEAYGHVKFTQSLASAASAFYQHAAANTTHVDVDTTAERVVNLCWQFETADAGNVLTISEGTIEIMRPAS